MGKKDPTVMRMDERCNAVLLYMREHRRICSSSEIAKHLGIETHYINSSMERLSTINPPYVKIQKRAFRSKFAFQNGYILLRDDHYIPPQAAEKVEVPIVNWGNTALGRMMGWVEGHNKTSKGKEYNMDGFKHRNTELSKKSVGYKSFAGNMSLYPSVDGL